MSAETKKEGGDDPECRPDCPSFLPFSEPLIIVINANRGSKPPIEAGQGSCCLENTRIIRYKGGPCGHPNAHPNAQPTAQPAIIQ